MKKKLKKTIAVVMSVAMLFSMAGCGTNGETNFESRKSEGKKSEKAKDTKEMVFRGENFSLEGYQGNVGSICIKNDKIYFNTYEWIEETDEPEDLEDTSSETEEDLADGEENEGKGRTVSRLYSADIDGSNVTEIPFVAEANAWINLITAGQDDTIAFLLSSYDEKTDKVTDMLVKIDGQGNELLRTDIAKELNMAQNDYSINKILIDNEGRLIVTMDQMVCILDENGKSIGEVKSDNYLEGAAITKDGEVICASSVSIGEDRYAQVQVLDVEGKKWGDTIKLDLRYFNSSDSVMNGMDYDFYYKDDSGIYGYDMEEEMSDKIIDYLASDITFEDSWSIVLIGDDKLLGTSQYNLKTNFILYSKVDPADLEEKKIITYGALLIDNNVEKAVIAFNRASKEYRIEFKDYSEEGGSTERMTADILAGNVPDIIELGYGPVDQYIAKGLLEDLTPYYGNDSELGTDDILDSVLEAMKVDDKIYYVTPGFNIASVIAGTADVGNGTGWTFDELKAVLEKKGDGVRPFWSSDKAGMLFTLLENGLSDFVDWQTGECSFESQDFKDILEICNDRGTDKYDDSTKPDAIQESRVLCLEVSYLEPEAIELYEKMFNGDVTYIGYPNKEKEGSYFQFDSQMGIYSKSEVKDGAWEFIRTFMSKEYQGTSDMAGATPTRKDCFEMFMKQKTATEAYTDEFGQRIMPLDGARGSDNLEVEIKPLTDEQADMYINLVNSTKKNGYYDQAIMQIVLEEANIYFAGEKSLDEIVEIIQNRVKTYVNESR